MAAISAASTSSSVTSWAASLCRIEHDLVLLLFAAGRDDLRNTGTASKPASTTVSATVRSSSGECRSDSSSMNSISPMIDETGARNGGSTPSAAAIPDTSVSFSVTIWRARWMSCPQSNSTQMTATPTAVAERTRRTPAAPLSADSIGKRDQRLHLERIHARRFDQNRHGGRREIRQHVQRNPRGRPAAPDQEGRRERDDRSSDG